jgi:hypothetical protein
MTVPSNPIPGSGWTDDQPDIFAGYGALDVAIEQHNAEEDRRQRGIKYVVHGVNAAGGLTAEIAINTDYNCIVAAKLWSRIYKGDAECYCVMDGKLGGRPFYKEWYKN